MTAPEAQARVEYWLKRFGMAEWEGTRPGGDVPRVRVRFRTKGKMEDSVGSCEWHAEDCTAEISLRRGQGEDTLVHEVIHLLLEGHTTYKEEKYSEMHERAINRLTAALLIKEETH